MVSPEPFEEEEETTTLTSATMRSVNKHSSSQRNTKHSSFISDTFLFIVGSMVALLFVWGFWSFLNPNPNSSTLKSSSEFDPSAHLRYDPSNPTFYDDPSMSYSMENPIKNWDQKRKQWLGYHPLFEVGLEQRILLLTGSQPSACENPIGDHLLLRFFKNKVDYCRIHGYDIFYNNALFHPKMNSFWAKLPVVKAAMIAHPESEWIWWVDSDAAFTDMEFKLPLDRYRNHNLIVHGWPHLIYENRSWVSLNAGIFLMRNCQWSMDFMDVWASMGPQSPDYVKWGELQRAALPDKMFPASDDQSALVYLLLKEKDKWGDKIYLESQFDFEAYWVGIVGILDNISSKYKEKEEEVAVLRRRHAEKVTEKYAEMRESHLKEAGYGGTGSGSWRRPFITHFTGCQPCSGKFNPTYSAERCWNGMNKVLNFADNQILRNYGLVRRDLMNSSNLSPLAFDSPVG